MNAYMLIKVRELVHTAVEYTKGEGAWCPVCAHFQLGQFRLVVHNTEGDGLRYARCKNCGFSFKTVEKIVISETAELLATSATVTYPKGKRRKKR